MLNARGRSFALPAFSAALVFAGALVGSVAVATAAVPDEVKDAAGAEKLAKQSGKSITIGAETTDTSEIKANPDGSRTLVTYTHPVRVKQNNAWAAVDLTLVRQSDGSLAPKAAPVTMSFTPGGPGSAKGPVARLVKGEAEVGFGWAEDLPPATISGQVATYPDVLPGVDLEVRAALTGFSQNLVVKTAEAAGNPKLKKITFRSHTKNTKIGKVASARVAAKSVSAPIAAGLVVTGADGKQVFGGDASQMWDSSESARRAVMGVEVGADTISITPDQTFLADPSTTYPVRLDPDYHCTTCSKTHHVVVQSPPEWADATNYDRTDGQLGDLKAGYLNASSLGSRAAGVSRTYFEMNTTAVVGTTIKSATLKAKVINSYSCSPTPTQLWVTGAINSSTTWNRQTNWDMLVAENNTRNNPNRCAEEGGADFDATAGVVYAARAGATGTTFMFKAKDEKSLDDSWRRFALNPYLEVRYNSTPNTPVDHGMEGWGPNRSDALPCRAGNDRPRVFTRTPRLRARVSDPDGGILLDTGFVMSRGPVGNSSWIAEPVALNVSSGSYAEVTVPDGVLSEDGVYNWVVYTGDAEIRSPRTGDCEFTVDTVAPNKPSVSSNDYPATGTNGSVGRTGTFTFSPNGNTGLDGTMDVVRYGWSLNVDTFENRLDVTSADGAMTVPITPTQGGTNTLYLQAYDKAGNRAAAAQTYVFNVADPTGPVAAWNFDETGGTTGADITGKGHPLTLSGSTFGSGYAGNGQVNTTSSFSTTSSAVVDTSRAFSVSAWVKLANTNAAYTVVSQEGNRASSFFLEYSPTADRWALSATGADEDSTGFARALSSTPPQVGVWTHLLGTYEPNTSKLSLYVNGKLDGTANATLWNAAGPFAVGTAKWRGDRVNRLPGTVDHVQVWDRVLSAAEAANQNNLVVLRAHYNLDERTGTTTKDEVSGQNATLSGVTAWAGTPADPDDPNQILSSRDKWLNLDPLAQGSVAGARPGNFRTDRSYTVSAWVRHSGAFSVPDTAIGMGDTMFSPFLLCYRPESGKWGFTQVARADGGSSLIVSDQPAEVDKWVHLVGIYDATSGTMTLYVNGVKQIATKTGQGAFNASGDFWLGRGVWNGNRTDGWKGDIDDARIYSGAMTAQNVRDMYFATKHI